MLIYWYKNLNIMLYLISLSVFLPDHNRVSWKGWLPSKLVLQLVPCSAATEIEALFGLQPMHSTLRSPLSMGRELRWWVTEKIDHKVFKLIKILVGHKINNNFSNNSNVYSTYHIQKSGVYQAMHLIFFIYKNTLCFTYIFKNIMVWV